MFHCFEGAAEIVTVKPVIVQRETASMMEKIRSEGKWGRTEERRRVWIYNNH